MDQTNVIPADRPRTSADVTPDVSATSYYAHGSAELRSLARALGQHAQIDSLLGTFRAMIEPWGYRRVGDLRGWRSNVADDGTPYELSVAFSEEEQPEIRVLVEAQGESPGLDALWRAGKDLSRRLQHDFNASLSKLHEVEDLFEPRGAGRLAVWHAAAFQPEQAPEFKIYLDAQAQGTARAQSVVEEALWRLGYRHAWRRMLEGPLRRGFALDELKYFALDLSPHGEARAKVYVSHHGVSLAELSASLLPDACDVDSMVDFCRHMTGGEGPYTGRPIFTCTAFRDIHMSAPLSQTLYVPIVDYTSSDHMVRQRVSGYMDLHGLPVRSYQAALPAKAEGKTNRKHSYVGLRHDGGKRRLTVYVSPQAHAPMPITPAPSERKLRPAEEIVERYERKHLLTDHPFFQRLQREPVHFGHLWLIMANFWEGVVHDFPARLAHVVAKVSDDRARCLLAKQLNDELGEGDFQRAHRGLFRTLLDGLAPYRLALDDTLLLAPGRELHARLNEPLYSTDEYESIGALMLIEIYGKQVDVRLGSEFRRQHELPREVLTWLHLHEELEVDHAEDSLCLARLVPAREAHLAAAWAGAEAVARASEQYFDALYRLCYP
ncbi:iron-containing redox enzyme family protein [Polyangium sp. 15x6]|uniref:iron-containing redox enzyme family protein n=1 Tax=Polyangium sp. 15x6 TaxID=3042687 RepID=UPI00249B5A2C|nr:iron-containing redox enzyme family protein [Polyangium sp. 15x6]MDI3288663.1 iron-containing redox enzyme family protein [Polyangium sp. 15x6]